MGNGIGGVSSCQNPFNDWWLHQGTQEDIKIRGGFAVQKLPINSTATALNAEKDKYLLGIHPRSVDIHWL